MNTKFLLINRAFEGTLVNTNKGMEAILISIFHQLRKIDSGAKITTFIQMKPEFAHRYDVQTTQLLKPSSSNFTFFSLIEQIFDILRCMFWKGVKKQCKKDLRFLLKSRRLRIIREADVVIQAIADSYSDMFLPWIIQHSLDLLICKCLQKPFIFYGATIQVKRRLGKWITKFTLNKADVIVLREKHSKTVLEAIGITSPTYITFDPAFYLETTGVTMDLKSFGVTNEHPVFGMCIGDKHPLLSNKREGIIPFMYSTALYLRYFLPSKVFLT